MYTVIYRVYKIDLDITIVMDVPKRGQQGDMFAVVRSSSRRGVSHKARERYMAINRSVKHGRLSCNVTMYSSSSNPWSCIVLCFQKGSFLNTQDKEARDKTEAKWRARTYSVIVPKSILI